MESVKRRHRRAVERAKALLERPPASYKVYIIRDPIFDIIAVKQSEVLILKVVMDEISTDDVRLVRAQPLPGNMTKKILKKEYRKEGFEERILN